MIDQRMTTTLLMMPVLASAVLLSNACTTPDDPWADEDLDAEIEFRIDHGPRFDLGGIDVDSGGPLLDPSCPAPWPYTDDPCLANCVPGTDLGEIICDFSSGAGTDPVTVWAATDLHGMTNPNYQVWGSDQLGNEFCCDFQQGVRNLQIIGTNLGDEVSFDWNAGQYVLDSHPNDATHLVVEVYGAEGMDTVLGSPADDDDYSETFYGGAHIDTFDGQAGSDTAYGGAGDDILVGGAGNDELHGGPGHDHIAGDHGEDVLWGDEGNDHIAGGPDGDQIYGGTGDDALCSGNDGGTPEIVFSGPGSDEVWVPINNVTPNLGVGPADHCGNSTHQSAGLSCNWTLNTAPNCS